MSDSYLEIQLDQQPIELYKLLKIADLVTGGGEAKVVITQGYVLLNGEVEYQKRKKVYHDDVVEFNGEIIQVIVNEALNEQGLIENRVDTELENKAVKQSFEHNNKYDSKKTKSTNDKQKKAAPTIEGTARTSKRKPISF